MVNRRFRAGLVAQERTFESWRLAQETISTMSQRSSSQDCEKLLELLPAYSLGATDPDESAFVEARLADCPEAAAELASYAGLGEALLFSAPPLEAPAGLADRLRVASAPVARPAPRSPMARQASTAGFGQRIREALGVISLRPAGVLAGLAILLLVVMNLYLLSQVAGLRGQQDALADQIAGQGELLAMVDAGEALRFHLPAGPAGVDSGAMASVICNPEQNLGFIYAENLSPLPAGMAYQVWLIHEEERVSGGLFAVDERGSARLVVRISRPFGEIDAIGITAEPASGSPGPTSPPVIRGILYGDEDA